jgi:hypothetical protein
VLQLAAHVAVVDVERGGAGPMGTDEGLDVLRPVEEVEAHVVVGRQPRPIRVGDHVAADAVGEQVVGQAPGLLVQRAPREATVPPHEALAVGDGGGDGVGQPREVQHGGLLRRDVQTMLTNGSTTLTGRS